MSLLLSQPCSPPSSFGFGFGYDEDEFNLIPFSPPPSPSPLSPLWLFSNIHHNQAAHYCPGVYLQNPLLAATSDALIAIVEQIICQYEKRGQLPLPRTFSSPHYTVIHSAEFPVDALVPAEPETSVEQVPEYSRADPLSLNQTPEVLVMQDVTSVSLKAACMNDATAKLDLQAQQSTLGLDEIERDSGCEGQSITTVIRDKSNISASKYATSGSAISLEDLQQHISMTREEAAKSIGVSVSTLKRICRRHHISRWPFQKKRKGNPLNVTVGDSTAGEVNQTSMITNPSLWGVKPMAPSTQLEENRGCDTYLCLNSDKKQSSTVTLSHTLSLETLEQDLGSVAKEAADDSSLNKPPLILVDLTSLTEKATQGSDTIAELDSEVQKSMVGCDGIEGGDGICEAEGLVSINIVENQKQRTILSSKRARGGSLITLEDLQQHCSMTREEAAKSLGVSISTVKRVCRQNGVPSWLSLKRMKKYESPSELKSMNIIEQDTVAAGSSQTSAIPSSSIHAVNRVQDVQFVTVKATYVDKMIKFQLPPLSKFLELEEEVAKRLKLEVGRFSIEYVDEDGDQILLTSSEDLRYCIDTWTSLGKTIIRMIVKLTTS